MSTLDRGQTVENQLQLLHEVAARLTSVSPTKVLGIERESDAEQGALRAT